MQSTLRFTDYHSKWTERLKLISDKSSDLFSQLESHDLPLSFKEFSTINYLLILSNKLLNAAQLKVFSQNMVKLLATRLDPTASTEVLQILWKDTNALTVEKVYRSYILSLVDQTETTLKPELANDCYLDFCETLQQQHLEEKYLLDFLERIVDRRNVKSAAKPEETVVLSIAMLALTAQTQALAYNYEKSYEVCKKVLELSESFLTRLPAQSINAQLVQHLIRVETSLLIIDKRAPEINAFETAETLASVIGELLSRGTESLKQVGQQVINLMAQLSQKNLELPKNLSAIINRLDAESVTDSIVDIERHYPTRVVSQVVDHLILIKLEDGIKSNAIVLLALLGAKTKAVRASGGKKEMLQMIELQQRLVLDCNAIENDTKQKQMYLDTMTNKGLFESQMIYLNSILGNDLADQEHFKLAFKFTIELIESAGQYLSTSKTESLFRVINLFLSRDQHEYATELLLSLMLKSEGLEFNDKMNATFDNVLCACIRTDHYGKAQSLLQQSAEIAMCKGIRLAQNEYVKLVAQRFIEALKTTNEKEETSTRVEPLIDLAKLKVGLKSRKENNRRHEELELFYNLLSADLPDNAAES